MSLTWEGFEKEQPFAAKMLRNSLKKNRVSHAYLFEGDRGTGKQAASLLMAKSLYCEDPGAEAAPCESCVNCKRINSGNHPDIHIIEPDGLSIKKEQILSLRAEFSRSAMESDRKLYIISNAEKMSIAAANSLLKFLEEPNSETTAILMTEQPQRILPTILSRCQSVLFKALPASILSSKLQEAGIHHVKAPLLAAVTNNIDEALELDGDDWFAQARKIVLKLYKVQNQNPLYAMTSLQDEWVGHFKEKDQLDLGLSLLLLVYRDLLYIQMGKDDQLVYPDQRNIFETTALHTSSRRLSEQMTAILEAKRKLNANVNPQLLMEQLVLNLQGGPSFV